MKPLVEGLEKQYKGKVTFNRVNGDTPQGGQTMQQFGASYYPTFVFVNKNGSVAKTLVGAQTADQLKAQLDQLK